jgi:hypothetical protein
MRYDSPDSFQFSYITGLRSSIANGYLYTTLHGFISRALYVNTTMRMSYLMSLLCECVFACSQRGSGPREKHSNKAVLTKHGPFLQYGYAVYWRASVHCLEILKAWCNQTKKLFCTCIIIGAASPAYVHNTRGVMSYITIYPTDSCVSWEQYFVTEIMFQIFFCSNPSEVLSLPCGAPLRSCAWGSSRISSFFFFFFFI